MKLNVKGVSSVPARANYSFESMKKKTLTKSMVHTQQSTFVGRALDVSCLVQSTARVTCFGYYKNSLFWPLSALTTSCNIIIKMYKYLCEGNPLLEII